jgi:hypothetical protein
MERVYFEQHQQGGTKDGYLQEGYWPPRDVHTLKKAAKSNQANGLII